VVRRILAGVFGAILGAGIGAPIAYSTRVALTPVLSMMMAMAVAACVFALVRRPPWRQASAVESLLRVVVGLAVGAGLAWLAQRFVDLRLPLAVPPLPNGVTFTEHGGVFGSVVGLVTGLLIGLEPAPPPEAPRSITPERRVVAEE
jgi:hypothetical protein